MPAIDMAPVRAHRPPNPLVGVAYQTCQGFIPTGVVTPQAMRASIHTENLGKTRGNV
jgi:hypothetical protein